MKGIRYNREVNREHSYGLRQLRRGRPDYAIEPLKRARSLAPLCYVGEPAMGAIHKARVGRDLGLANLSLFIIFDHPIDECTYLDAVQPIKESFKVMSTLAEREDLTSNVKETSVIELGAAITAMGRAAMVGSAIEESPLLAYKGFQQFVKAQGILGKTKAYEYRANNAMHGARAAVIANERFYISPNFTAQKFRRLAHKACWGALMHGRFIAAARTRRIIKHYRDFTVDASTARESVLSTNKQAGWQVHI